MSQPTYGRWMGNCFRYHGGILCLVQQLHPAGCILTLQPAPMPWGCQPATEAEFTAELAQALHYLTASTPDAY